MFIIFADIFLWSCCQELSFDISFHWSHACVVLFDSNAEGKGHGVGSRKFAVPFHHGVLQNELFGIWRGGMVCTPMNFARMQMRSRALAACLFAKGDG